MEGDPQTDYWPEYRVFRLAAREPGGDHEPLRRSGRYVIGTTAPGTRLPGMTPVRANQNHGLLVGYHIVGDVDTGLHTVPREPDRLPGKVRGVSDWITIPRIEFVSSSAPSSGFVLRRRHQGGKVGDTSSPPGYRRLPPSVFLHCLSRTALIASRSAFSAGIRPRPGSYL